MGLPEMNREGKHLVEVCRQILIPKYHKKKFLNFDSNIKLPYIVYLDVLDAQHVVVPSRS